MILFLQKNSSFCVFCLQLPKLYVWYNFLSALLLLLVPFQVTLLSKILQYTTLVQYGFSNICIKFHKFRKTKILKVYQKFNVLFWYIGLLYTNATFIFTWPILYENYFVSSAIFINEIRTSRYKNIFIWFLYAFFNHFLCNQTFSLHFQHNFVHSFYKMLGSSFSF